GRARCAPAPARAGSGTRARRAPRRGLRPAHCGRRRAGARPGERRRAAPRCRAAPRLPPVGALRAGWLPAHAPSRRVPRAAARLRRGTGGALRRGRAASPGSDPAADESEATAPGARAVRLLVDVHRPGGRGPARAHRRGAARRGPLDPAARRAAQPCARPAGREQWRRARRLLPVPAALEEDLRWADTVFVEWGSHTFAWLTFLDLAPFDVRVVARIHRYEILTPYPLLARCAALDEIAFVAPTVREM